MTAQPATSPLVLRRLSSDDDLSGAAALMADYVAEIRAKLLDGQPAGTGGLKDVAPGVAEIRRMYVDPPVRGQGVARALLERLVDDGRAAGFGTLRLETAVWMVEAHALYRSCGFVDAEPFPDPEFGCFPGLDHLARYMTLPLHP